MNKFKIQDATGFIKGPQNRWRRHVFLIIILYFIIVEAVIDIRPDHAFLAVFVFCLTLGKEKSRRFLIDWAPFLLFWVAYDLMRGVTDLLRPTVNVVAPYRWELFLFGPLFGGQIPNFYYQYYQVIHDGELVKILLDIMGAIFYVLHFVAHLIMGWIFWHTTSDRRTFYHYIYTITVLSIMAIVTFMVFPAAPPWYVYKYGLIKPVGTIIGSAGGLVNFDNLIGFRFLQSIWDNFNSNLFAAIPSLHGAHACVIAFFGMQKFRRYRPLWLLHPLGTWFSAVYLNEHYIIDLIIGLIYSIIAYISVRMLIYPKLFKKYVEKKETT